MGALILRIFRILKAGFFTRPCRGRKYFKSVFLRSEQRPADSRSSGEDSRRCSNAAATHLFRPFTARSVIARNHHAVAHVPILRRGWAPQRMALYSFASRAIGGAGIVCTEVVHCPKVASHRLSRHLVGRSSGCARASAETIDHTAPCPEAQIGCRSVPPSAVLRAAFRPERAGCLAYGKCLGDPRFGGRRTRGPLIRAASI